MTAHTLTSLFAFLVFAAPAAAFPLLSEVLYDAAGADDGKVFVELYGSPGADLEGLRLEAVNGDGGAITAETSLSGRFDASGFFVIADLRADGTSDVPGAHLLVDFDVQNGPDSLRLLRGSAVIDAVGFGSFGPELVFAGEGRPAPDAPAGQSLARFFANLDRDDNALDFGILEVPTPGTGPTVVPEPGTLGLASAGLLWLAYLGRCRGRARSRASRYCADDPHCASS